MGLSVVCVGLTFLAPLVYNLLANNDLAEKVKKNFFKDDGDSKKEPLNFFQYDKFPRAFWFLFFKVGSLYGCIFPFETFGTSLLREEYGLTIDQAGFLIS